MNWTEGGLARHSRASKGRVVLLRQKEHFAKARAGLLNSNVKISPPSISFLAHPAASSSPHRQSSKSKNSSGAASSSKKRHRDKDPPHSSQYFQDDAGSKLPTPADFQKDLAEEEALRQKRRKLLLKGDWTGINLQKPIQMEFSKARSPHDGPWGLSKSRHTRSSKDRQRRMLGVEHGRVHQARSKAIRPVSPRQMRVRVGSRERALGGSSNASPRSRTCRDVESSPQAAPISKSKHREKRRRRTIIHDTATPSNTQASKSPELHQPVPHRPFLPSLLHSMSSDPDDAASTKARVGVLLPDVPSSQMEQNEAWWTFVGGVEHNHIGSGQQPPVSQESVQREVSPGISQLGLSRGFDKVDGRRRHGQASPNHENRSSIGHYSSRQESLLQHDPLQLSVRENVSLDKISCEPDSSSLGSSPPRSKRTLRSTENMVPGKDCPHPESADEESQIALPTSSSPTSGETLAQCPNYANFQDADIPNTGDQSGNADERVYSDTSDEVSQVALPTSSSPTPGELLAQFYNFTGMQDVEPQGTNVRSDIEHEHEVHDHIQPRDTKHEGVGQGHTERGTEHFMMMANPARPELPREEPLAVANRQYEKGQETKKISCNDEEDENDIWKKFVFGEADDGFQEAFLEASKETAKNLCPSDSSSSTGEDEVDVDMFLRPSPPRMTAASGESSGVEEPRFGEAHSSSSTGGTATTSTSRRATTGSSSPDPLADLSAPSFASQYDSCSNDANVMDVVSNQATSGGSSPDPLSTSSLGHANSSSRAGAATALSSSTKSAPLSVEDEFLRRSDLWSLATVGDDNASLVAHPPSTHQDSEAESFKFARPKPFTGKKIQIDEQRQIALSTAQIRGKGVNWRRQKRAGDGRAKIRNLPNFSDDPIEEVEEDEDSFAARTTLKPALFGSLDTEDDF